MQAAPSMGLIPMQQQQPSDQLKHLPSNDNGVRLSKFWSLCQPKFITCAAVVVFCFTFILSTVLVTEQANLNNSLLEKVSSSFKTRLQTEGLSGNGTECKESPGRQKGKEMPSGMVAATSDLQMRSLYEKDVKNALPKNLLAMAVGIKQKSVVNDIVQKFPSHNFTIMLFHYDGVVEQWQDLAWSNQSIHIMALHQTKWWFAKRFMHPDIVDQYNYIFLWDEDLGVQHFHAGRYLEIMHAEGLEISQPALDPASLEIHHKITVRHPRLTAHRSIITRSCSADNKAVPCTGYVEVMAPVFSRAAWQCVWHMIQNDLIHGWGIDLKIGYCAQGLRSEKVGIIDAEYILHKGIPSLGGPHVNKTILAQNDSISGNDTTKYAQKVQDPRHEVRKKSSKELLVFQRRWAKAAQDDPTWQDPYEAYAEVEMYHSKTRTPPVPIVPPK